MYTFHQDDGRCNAVHGDGQADTEFWGIVADFCYFSLSIMTTTGVSTHVGA